MQSYKYTSILLYCDSYRFKQFCKAALRSLEAPLDEHQLGSCTYRLNDSCACVCDLENITFSTAKQLTSEALDPFTGFSCTLMHFRCIQVGYFNDVIIFTSNDWCCVRCLQSLEVTVRQLKAINTVGGTANFSALIICELEDAKTVQETLVKCGIPYQSIGFVHSKTPITATCPNSK